MNIKENISLKPYNTFGIDSKARYFVQIHSLSELEEVLKLPNFPDKFILGGGSNILLAKNIEALVIHVALKGIQILNSTDAYIDVRVMAGENWHDFVSWAVDNNYGGLENLSLIPGNVGTAPIQNIGAYGIELKDLFLACEAMEISTQKTVHFDKEACEFGYRNSIFKNKAKGKFIITSVDFRLTTKNHVLNTSYGAIDSELAASGIESPSIQDISEAVIRIRQKKLPDPVVLGNSGSFFKNPEVSKTVFESFHKKFPDAPFYKISDTLYKIPAGWLIEFCGFKGKRYGDAGVHKNQALVLVNYGNAQGKDILDLSTKIQQKVLATFGISIIPEVNIVM